MSECVVRMEMPGCCWDCPCLDDYGDYPRCRISNEQRGYNFPIHEKRMPRCPITQPLPEGHGRLVDAEEMYKKSEAFCNQCKQGEHDCEKCNYIVAQGYMYKSPTIVPAERSET